MTYKLYYLLDTILHFIKDACFFVGAVVIGFIVLWVFSSLIGHPIITVTHK